MSTITVQQFRAARTFLGWSQRYLAVKARVGRSSIANFELGTAQPHPRLMRTLLKRLNVPVSFSPRPSKVCTGLESLQMGCGAHHSAGQAKTQPPVRKAKVGSRRHGTISRKTPILTRFWARRPA